MQSIRSLRSLPINAVVCRALFVKLGSGRLNSYCVVQKVTASSRLQQSVPLPTAFRVASRHFSLKIGDSSSDLPVFDMDSKLVLKNGQPFTGCGQVNYSVEHNYTGAFMDGKRHGHGMSKYANGDIYEGEWKYNKKEGRGIFMDAEGKIIAQGLFKEYNLFTGKGNLKTRNGSIYEGELLEGQRHGQGKYTTRTGMVWEGEFRHDKPFNGKGWFHCKQGVWVEGVFTVDNNKKPVDSLETTFPSDVGLVKKDYKPAVKRAVKPEEEVEEEESEWGMKY